MRFCFQLLGLGFFAVFWLVSTPVYFLNDFFQWVDRRLGFWLDDLFSYRRGE